MNAPKLINQFQPSDPIHVEYWCTQCGRNGTHAMHLQPSNENVMSFRCHFCGGLPYCPSKDNK